MTNTTPPAAETDTPAKAISPNVLRAWGKALVKTGTEHLDLTMVRQGKKVLAEAATPAPAVRWKP